MIELIEGSPRVDDLKFCGIRVRDDSAFVNLNAVDIVLTVRCDV